MSVNLRLMSINTDALFTPEYNSVEATITVPKEISALELVQTEAGERLGQIAAVPKGTCLELCGSGFNERTIKVRFEKHLYFVFLQDLAPPEDAGTAECGSPFPVNF